MNKPKMTQEEFEQILVDALSLDPESDILARMLNYISITLDSDVVKAEMHGKHELAMINRMASNKIFEALEARGFYVMR